MLTLNWPLRFRIAISSIRNWSVIGSLESATALIALQFRERELSVCVCLTNYKGETNWFGELFHSATIEQYTF